MVDQRTKFRILNDLMSPTKNYTGHKPFIFTCRYTPSDSPVSVNSCNHFCTNDLTYHFDVNLNVF